MIIYSLKKYLKTMHYHKILLLFFPANILPDYLFIVQMKMDISGAALGTRIEEGYIAKNPLPEDDFWMRVSIRMMAQMVADEVVQFQVIEV